ncbi:MAG: glycosyltransferase [Mycobacteriales bacterium]
MQPSALWVTVESPDRHLTGGSIREAYLLEALARRMPTDLLLVGHLADDLTRAAVRDVIEIDPPSVPVVGRNRARLSLLWQTLVRRRTVSIVNNRQHRALLRPLLDQMAARYDVVCVEHDRLAPLAPRRRDNRWVITLQNLVSVQLRHELAITAGSRQRWLVRRRHAVANRWERRMAKDYDQVIVTSPEDAAAFPGPATVVPNGVDTSWYTPTALPREPRLVFTGMLGWRPNVEGLEWFVREVWPEVRSQVPGATFDIVGASPVAAVTALGQVEGIEVHANVPFTRPYLQAARVAVVPLHVGSGTRLKALEAMASGRPVVGTTVGLEGLGVEHGRDVLVADRADDMVRAVTAVLQDDELAGRLVKHGTELVNSTFSWARIGPGFAETIAAEVRA